MSYEEALQAYNEAMGNYERAKAMYLDHPTEENLREAQAWAYTVSDCEHDLDRCYYTRPTMILGVR